MQQLFYVSAYLSVTVLYFLATWRAWYLLGTDEPATGSAPRFDWPLPLLIGLHTSLLVLGVAAAGGEFRFGFAQALSATLYLTVVALWIEGFWLPMRGLHPVVLPVAGVAALLPAFFPGTPVTLAAESLALRLHLLVAIVAYTLFTIAALHALLMSVLDRQLHSAAQNVPLARLFRNLPSLLAMERLLFQLISAGFLLLTATVVSGVLFSEYMFGRALRFEHKTVFAIASWLVFAGLLLGRFVFGWRGRVALRWTVAGFVMLFLAYVGSQFVIEVVLKGT